MKNLLMLSALLLSLYQSARSQNFCDSLDIKVSYHPFYDSLVEVRVWNSSQSFVDYPGFILYDTNNDTVAKETVDLFALTQAAVHTLNIYPGMPSSQSFSGRLELYGGFYDTLYCSYSQYFNLCPGTCKQALIYLGNMGGALFTGTVNYELKYAGTPQVIKSGILDITSSSQYDADTLCLLPGNYELHYSQINLTPGGQKYYGVNQDSATLFAPSWIHNGTADTVFTFSFYGNCPIPNAVHETRRAGFPGKLFAYQGELTVISSNDEAIESLSIFGLDGRRVYRAAMRNQVERISLRHLSEGIYIVRMDTKKGSYSQRVFIAP